MGLLLDSSILIAAERQGSNARRALTQIATHHTGEEIAISAITLLELAHGATRANSPERKAMRLQFIHELAVAVPVHPVSVSIALRAGQIDGEHAAAGVRLALADLLIGVTALELGYRIATTNVRHFRLVPGLEIAPV